MRSDDGQLIFSATDLSNYLACPQLTLLARQAALGGRQAPRFHDPALEALRRRGEEHEQRFRKVQEEQGLRVVEISPSNLTIPATQRWRQHAERTISAMRAGADVIYQGALFDGTWCGRPDFLRKVDTPSALGAWSYDVIDTKLARDAKGGALLQALLYADLLAGVQGIVPTHVYLALGGPEMHPEPFRVADYAAYFRSIKRSFLAHVANAPAEVSRAPEPVPHCDICDWSTICERERREVDHLSLVAGISRHQRRALVDAGVTRTAELAELDVAATRVGGVGRLALTRIREQARVQVAGRLAGRHLYELIKPIQPELGLAMLPEPSPGDLFFDLEGDPYALGEGLEFLFGWADAQGQYTGVWALDRAEEKRAFEQFIDFVMDRLEQYPNLHIYHYNHYEPTALKRLMGRFATREDEVDRLLRGRVFVDLYRAVKNAVRASVESYSIKRLEPLYGFTRVTELPRANRALASFEAWLATGTGTPEKHMLRDIEGYNRDDVLSTLALRDWLELLRTDHERRNGESIPRPARESREPSESFAKVRQEIADLMAMLTQDVPAETISRSPEQHARWLLAQLLEFHRREKKSSWWEFFRRIRLSDEELIQDSATLGGLEYTGVAGAVKRSFIHRYVFPPQEHDLKTGDLAIDPATQKSVGEVYRIDGAARVVELKRGRSNRAPHPTALIPDEIVNDDAMRESLQRIASEVATRGLDDANQYRSATDLLFRRPPRAGQTPGEPLVRVGESALDAATRLVAALDGSVLAIQGPPGAGKTYTAARMIVSELKRGRRIGITAPSHKVIGNLLAAVLEAAREHAIVAKGVQKAQADQACGLEAIEATQSNEEVREALLTGGVQLAAGTAWLWSREDMIASVDVLFIDEAGQFSLANAMAVAPAARNLVLLGDPRQLSQPLQGVHPVGSAASALDHLLGEALTIPPDRGIFLAETWRLHPDVTAFTSEVFYERRLQSRPGCERQLVRGSAALSGSGPCLRALEHSGNDNEAPEEVDVIVTLVNEILENGATWANNKGEEKPITLNDILIVAPYNGQVAALAARLPEAARVGTVDKFQGQEAPVAIYSTTSSSAEDTPRGMEFLYSPNRLNVATSRARCLAIVVASQQIFMPGCRTPAQMQLANAFCRFQELAHQRTALQEHVDDAEDCRVRARTEREHKDACGREAAASREVAPRER